MTKQLGSLTVAVAAGAAASLRSRARLRSPKEQHGSKGGQRGLEPCCHRSPTTAGLGTGTARSQEQAISDLNAICTTRVLFGVFWVLFWDFWIYCTHNLGISGNIALTKISLQRGFFLVSFLKLDWDHRGTPLPYPFHSTPCYLCDTASSGLWRLKAALKTWDLLKKTSSFFFFSFFNQK